MRQLSGAGARETGADAAANDREADDRASLIRALRGLEIIASLSRVVARQVRLQGVTVGRRHGFEAMPLAKPPPTPGRTVAFEGLADAMDRLRQSGHFGKTLIGF